MYLKFIDESTVLKITEDVIKQKEPFTCEAVFYRLEDDYLFWASGEDLYENVKRVGENVSLSICFYHDSSMHTFSGKVKRLKMEGQTPLVLVEQVSGITPSSRREFDRSEVCQNVRVYGVDPAGLQTQVYRKASSTPEFIIDMFDISASGICLVSQDFLLSSSEPYFLLEFSLDAKSSFSLPAKLIRKGGCPQTALYRHDYGFEFDFSHAPEEKARLVMAIFNSKLAASSSYLSENT